MLLIAIIVPVALAMILFGLVSNARQRRARRRDQSGER